MLWTCVAVDSYCCGFMDGAMPYVIIESWCCGITVLWTISVINHQTSNVVVSLQRLQWTRNRVCHDNVNVSEVR